MAARWFHLPSVRGSWLPLCACLLTAWAAYQFAFALLFARANEHSSRRLDFYAQTLEAQLQRYEAIPTLVALDDHVVSLVANTASHDKRRAAQTHLVEVATKTGVSVVYLMNRQGLTLASSNANTAQSFVGQNYARRPYVQQALATEQGAIGRFYGVGLTTGIPGYFIAAPIRQAGQTIGVAAVKVDLGSFENAMTESGDAMLLSDELGVVFLASKPAWRYRAVSQLAASDRATLLETRQYGHYPLLPLFAEAPSRLPAWVRLGSDLAGPSTPSLWLQGKAVAPLGWRLLLLTDPSESRLGAWLAALAAGLAAALLWATSAARRRTREHQREIERRHAELEAAIADRTADLSAKLVALQQTERILRATQNKAVQAGKLAVLGQLSVGMNHELNQPLAALALFTDNSIRLLDQQKYDEVADNLSTIRTLVERTGRIVRELQTFARNAPATVLPVSLHRVIDHVLLLVEPFRRDIGATLRPPDYPCPLPTLATDATRLEQILVNLCKNALDAVSGRSDGKVSLSLDCPRPGEIEIAVIDNGEGLTKDVLDHLFEPFYTTKPVGSGLGLGLALSHILAQSLGGSLTADNAPLGGARFVLRLPLEGYSDAT